MKTTGDGQRQPDVHSGICILVVEDIAANQQVARAILEHAGYATDVVVDGKAAIAALESKPYDLVLMDCCMPLMDGFEATRSIRAAGSRVLNPEIPIIALTALAMSGDREKCLEAGMDGYLSKPVDPAKLISAIEGCLKTALGRRSAAAHGALSPLAADPAKADADWSETAKRTSFEWPPGLLETVIGLFLDDAPLQIAELQTALRSRDSAILRAVSHKMRGSSDILGTASISALAMAVEEAAKREDFKRAAELTPKLIEELQKLLSKLANFDAQDPP